MTPLATQYGVHPARVITPLPRARRVALGAYRRRRAFGQLTASQIVGATGTLATSAASAAGMAAKSLSQTTGVLASLGSAAPFIGIGVEVATLLMQFVGKGCGSACIDASKAEQIYEAATDDVWAAAKAGMISIQQFLSFAQAALQAGQQHLATFGTSQAQKGSQNMTNVISTMINTAPGSTVAAPIPLDINAAQALYISGAGWYPDSLAAAGQLATTYLQSLLPAGATSGTATSSNGGVAAATGDITSLLSATVYGIPVWMLAAGAAFLIFR
jgi:hypothetical protein